VIACSVAMSLPSYARRMRLRWFVLTMACALGSSVLVACSSGDRAPSASSTTRLAAPPTTATAPASLPHTPAGAQARWVLAALGRLPIRDADVRAHFDAAFLAQVSAAALNQALRSAADARLASISVNRPSALAAIVSVSGHTQLRVDLSVDARGLISGLLLRPIVKLPPSPATWAGVDAALRSVAPEVHLFVGAVTNGTCDPVHAIDPDTPAPLGSAFKLYVLDALGRAVASHKVSWDQRLTISAQLKSLPSGVLQTEPDGTQISVRDVAAKMISISDNTAADLLMHLLGRSSVEAALGASGMTDPARDVPFLTTRELFTLKLDDWPTLANRYGATDTPGRRALLAHTVDPAALPAATPWTIPRDIDTVEWFASAKDICRVFATLSGLARQPGLAPIGDVFALNDGGLSLDPAQWQTTWFKGGSEPGVLTLSYLATTRTGHTYVVSALAENPSAPIAKANASLVMASAIKGALTLAARP